MTDKLFQWREKPLLLDGGMGRELRFRGVQILDTIWSANALIVAPQVVRQIHLDYINAGSDIITTNTYGVIKQNLGLEGFQDRFEELNILACKLAIEAKEMSGQDILIAGSIPPLKGSYRPDLVGSCDEIEALYDEQTSIMAPYVDFFLCETMSCAEEGLAAARASSKTGKPVWVSWTLHEDRSGRLRSSETISEAFAVLEDVPVSGVLANCCSPESITAALPDLVKTGLAFTGGYANTFQQIPQDWVLDSENNALIGIRDDLDPQQYSLHVEQWLRLGATVVGGCCGTRPSHIAKLKELITALY